MRRSRCGARKAHGALVHNTQADTDTAEWVVVTAASANKSKKKMIAGRYLSSSLVPLALRRQWGTIGHTTLQKWDNIFLVPITLEARRRDYH